MADRPGERHPRIGIDGKGRLFPLRDSTDVRFADIGVDLHLCEVECDKKKIGRRKARGHRLSHFHVPCDDDAVHGRPNGRVLQIQFGGVHGGFGLLHLRQRHVDLGIRPLSIGDRHIDFVLRDELLRRKRLRPSQFSLALRLLVFGPGHVGLGHVKIAGRLIPASAEWLGINDRDNVPGLDDRVEIGMEAFDHTGHLRPHLHGHDGIDRPRGSHNGHHRTALDGRGPVTDGHLTLAVKHHVPADGESYEQDRADEEKTAHWTYQEIGTRSILARRRG